MLTKLVGCNVKGQRYEGNAWNRFLRRVLFKGEYARKYTKEMYKSFVEIELLVTLFDVILVTLFKVLCQNHVSVLTHGLHTCLQNQTAFFCLLVVLSSKFSAKRCKYLLTNGVDVGARNLVWTGDIILKVDFFTQIHFAGNCGEN